jgi:hypothetical protein
VRRLLVTAKAVPSSPILVTLMMEALGSSETSVLTRATRRIIPEDGILHLPLHYTSWRLRAVLHKWLQQSVSLSVCMLLGNAWAKRSCGNEYTGSNKRIIARAVFYAVRNMKRASRSVRIFSLRLLVNNSERTFPRQQIIVGGVVVDTV